MMRWIGPAVVAVIVLVAFQWFAMPVIADLRADWAFLHTARMQHLQRQVK